MMGRNMSKEIMDTEYWVLNCQRAVDYVVFCLCSLPFLCKIKQCRSVILIFLSES